MAQYKTHAKFNVFLGLPIFLYLLYAIWDPKIEYMLTFGGCFVYSTFFMNPDMDIANKIKFFSFKGFLTLPFRFYALIFNHRGISHKIIIGTLTRILFLSLFFIAILALIDFSMISQKMFMSFWYTYKPYIIFGFVGICISDFCHILLDLRSSH